MNQSADRAAHRGFTNVPNTVLLNRKLSAGARLTYALLLQYAWNGGEVCTITARLADDMDSKEPDVRAHLDQLEATGLLAIDQKGNGMSERYSVLLSFAKHTFD